MSLNEVCSSLVFIRVTVLEKELHLNLFALAPAPGWVIIQWLAVSSNVEGNVFSLKENNKIRVYIHALIDFASYIGKYFMATLITSQGPVVKSVKSINHIFIR